MFKVVFYRVALHQALVSNKSRGYGNGLSRATKKKLFECYCVNEHQLKTIKNYLIDRLGWEARSGTIFRYFIGHQMEEAE